MFDYNRMKSDYADEYSKREYNGILAECTKYSERLKALNKSFNSARTSSEEVETSKDILLNDLKANCLAICPNEETLCNLLIDICYRKESYKHIVWAVCGNQIVINLLKRNNNKLSFPKLDKDGDFEFNGNKYVMQELALEVDADDRC